MRLAAVLCAALVLGGCSASPAPVPSPTVFTPDPVKCDVHDELIAMFDRDQAGRLGGEDAEGDRARTARLAEIVEVCGWPTISLVGEDGEDAAWTIAQHSDLDPELQAQFLPLLRDAVEAGDASPGNLAYLEDRINAANGDMQNYGTQVGCGENGPVAATELSPDVDANREAAGLAPLEEYFAEMAVVCAQP